MTRDDWDDWGYLAITRDDWDDYGLQGMTIKSGMTGMTRDH